MTSNTSSVVRDATNSTVTAVAAGSTLHDSVTVDGGSGNPVPTGNVTIDWFTNGTCADAPASTSAPAALTGGSLEATAFAQGPLAPGEYAFEAHYLGDTNYAPSDGPCEPLQVVDSYITISPANPSNPAGTTQTLTVQVWTNDGSGSGYVGANGATVALALLAGSPGSFSGVSQTACVTDATGTCTIVTSDASVAEDFLQASASVTVGGVAMARSTGTPAPGHANSGNAVENWFLPPTPAISIAVSPGTQTISSGAAATFTVTVTNSGAVSLTSVTVADALAPSCNQTSPSNPALASMAPGASVTYSCSLANVTASFTNSMTTSGTSPSGLAVSATGSAVVTVTPPVTPPQPPPTPTGPRPTNPSILIVLDPKSQTVGLGTRAQFKITVTNTGDVSLADVAINDPNAKGCRKRLGTLAVGASSVYTCTKKATASFKSVVTATGRPPTGAPVKATDSAEISVAPFTAPKVTRVSISVTQPEPVATGGTATFTVTVMNSGNEPLRIVHVLDPQVPGCARTLRDLPAGQTKQYSCQSMPVQVPFENVATATGVGASGQVAPEAPSGPVEVGVGIEISVTTTTPTVKAGQAAVFTIVVTALQALHDVNVTDPQVKSCARPNFNMYPPNQIHYSCSLPNVRSPFANTVMVAGKTTAGDPAAAATLPITVKLSGES